MCLKSETDIIVNEFDCLTGEYLSELETEAAVDGETDIVRTNVTLTGIITEVEESESDLIA
jgi:hypothetical protein